MDPTQIEPDLDPILKKRRIRIRTQPVPGFDMETAIKMAAGEKMKRVKGKKKILKIEFSSPKPLHLCMPGEKYNLNEGLGEWECRRDSSAAWEE